MDYTTGHYVPYDPDTIWQEMLATYMAVGGDPLYPGDEKEITLRGVQAMCVQLLAAVDNGLRMATLRYALGDYLDLYGEGRGCARIEASSAQCEVRITPAANAEATTIQAGALMTADGGTMYALEEDVTLSGAGGAVVTTIICQTPGQAGNVLSAGTQMQLLAPVVTVKSIFTTAPATGGLDEEDDETYRERIRKYGLSSVTTGPKRRYESVAMAASGAVIDAEALNLGAGMVGVYLLLTPGADEKSVINAVEEALSPDDVRPLTDTVIVAVAEEKHYILNVQCVQEAGENLLQSLQAAADEYQAWQDNTIGRPFNPDRLTAMLYQAGATRTVWLDGSGFEGTKPAYIEIPQNARCRGKITLEVVTR